MRRSEILKGIAQVLAALQSSNLLDALKDAEGEARSATSSRDRVRPVLLDALRIYVRHAERFSPAAQRVGQLFYLERLEDTTIWARMLSDDPSNYMEMFYNITPDVDDALMYLPRIARLVEQDIDHALSLTERSDRLADDEARLLSVIVIENDNRFSTPERLITVLESIQTIYEVCAISLEFSPDDLSVVACDSGSDKSFDFLGAAKIIECVKEVILSLWDNVVFYRERKFSEGVKIMGEALTTVERIAELHSQGKIGPEEAEGLRRKLYGGMDKFLTAGATIPEIYERASNDPRQLMAPAPKLLAAPQISVSSPTPNHVQESDVVAGEYNTVSSQHNVASDFSPDERRELQALLRKMREQADQDKDQDTSDQDNKEGE